MDKVMSEIMELKNTVVEYKKMLRCVFEVSTVFLQENKKILINITDIDTCIDDIEGSS